MLWELLLVLLLIGAVVFMVYQNFLTLKFAPWVPSHMSMLRQALAWIQPSAGQTFIDLGCGDGRAVILATKEFQLQASGVDINPVLTLVAKIRLALAGQRGTIITGDLYRQDLSHASIVYIFGLPKTIADRLEKKLETELASGSYIISYSFSLSRHQPIHTMQHRWRKIMVYQIN